MRVTGRVSRASSHNVASGLAGQMIAHHSGDPDVTAVANAWRDFDIASANAWQSYATQELNAWQTAFDASAAEDRNYTHAVTPGYAALIADYATAGENYVIATAPLETAWTNSFAAAENVFYQHEADKFKDLDLQALSAIHTGIDAETAAAHGFMSGAIAQEEAYIHQINGDALTATKDMYDEIHTLSQSAVNHNLTREQAEATATKTALDAVVPLENDVAIGRAADMASRNSLINWRYASDLNAIVVTAFVTTSPTQIPGKPALEPLEIEIPVMHAFTVLLASLTGGSSGTGGGGAAPPPAGLTGMDLHHYHEENQQIQMQILQVEQTLQGSLTDISRQLHENLLNDLRAELRDRIAAEGRMATGNIALGPDPISQMALAEKFILAVQQAIASGQLAEDVVDRLQGLISDPKQVAIMLGMLAVYAGAHLTPFGYVADAYMLGSSAADLIPALTELYTTLDSATTQSEMDQAADQMAQLMAGPIADGFLKLLTMGAMKGLGKAKPDLPGKVLKDKVELNVGPNGGVGGGAGAGGIRPASTLPVTTPVGGLRRAGNGGLKSQTQSRLDN